MFTGRPNDGFLIGDVRGSCRSSLNAVRGGQNACARGHSATEWVVSFRVKKDELGKTMFPGKKEGF
jgi:hypothetical protein